MRHAAAFNTVNSWSIHHVIPVMWCRSWRAAVLMVQDEDEEVRFEAVQLARELAEDTSHQVTH